MTDYFLGFNLDIERQAVTSLLSMLQGAIASGASSVTICLTSRGGDYAQAAYAYEILSALPVPIFMHAIGTVRSSAIALLMAGSRRYAAAGTDFLLGETFVAPSPNLAHGEVLALDEAGRVDCVDQRAIERITKKTGRQTSEILELVGKRFFDAQLALSNGIIHEIRPLQIPTGAVFLQIS
jgi:ATP-dependent protease ClpP protease subunit